MKSLLLSSIKIKDLLLTYFLYSSAELFPVIWQVISHSWFTPFFAASYAVTSAFLFKSENEFKHLQRKQLDLVYTLITVLHQHLSYDNYWKSEWAAEH